MVQPSVSEGKLVQPSVSEGKLVQPSVIELGEAITVKCE